MRQHVPEVNGKPYGAIIDKFPGDDPSQEMAFLHESTLPRRISSILPLLRNLASVEFAGNGIAPGFALQLKLEEGTQRIDHTSPAMVTAGAVQEQATRKNLIKFYVRQSAQPTAAPFSYLQQLPSWPKTMRQNENGTREQVPDKSEAEGAVMISHTATWPTCSCDGPFSCRPKKVSKPMNQVWYRGGVDIKLCSTVSSSWTPGVAALAAFDILRRQ
jgi:hypothetical protein